MIGTILHWNGSAWSPSFTSGASDGGTMSFVNFTLLGVWGTSPSDAWAVGYGDPILHWNGSAWSPSRSGTSVELSGVWGSGPSDVWVAGAGAILHRL